MEMNGLRALINSPGTLHGITAPPERDEYGSDEDYDRAYHQWYVNVNYWRATKT